MGNVVQATNYKLYICIYCTLRTFHKTVLLDIKHLRGITVPFN